MRELVTTLLEATGLVAVAAGVTGGAWQWIGAWGLCIGGAVMIAGSALAVRATTQAVAGEGP